MSIGFPSAHARMKREKTVVVLDDSSENEGASPAKDRTDPMRRPRTKVASPPPPKGTRAATATTRHNKTAMVKREPLLENLRRKESTEPQHDATQAASDTDDDMDDDDDFQGHALHTVPVRETPSMLADAFLGDEHNDDITHPGVKREVDRPDPKGPNKAALGAWDRHQDASHMEAADKDGKENDEEEEEDDETELDRSDFYRRGKSAAQFADESASQLPAHQKRGTPIKRKRHADHSHAAEGDTDAAAQRGTKNNDDDDGDDNNKGDAGRRRASPVQRGGKRPRKEKENSPLTGALHTSPVAVGKSAAELQRSTADELRRTAMADNTVTAGPPKEEKEGHAKHRSGMVKEDEHEAEEGPPVTYTEADNIRILLATDNHLGYMERDPERGADAMKTFEEILKKAKKHKVDMVLLGGDLFHDNKPSRKTYFEVMRLLRQYCMGDDACQLSITGETAFGTEQNGLANYYDPHLKIALPIFSIHGNHDDPSGDGSLAALDLLSVTGLVNYYGRSASVDDIKVKPVCLQKGQTKLALYGIGNVRDERLHRTFLQEKVHFSRPPDKAKWFNLLAFHQNRVAHGPTNHIPETFLPEWMHLILWGHEHECQSELSVNSEAGFYITQPGSSVATSLSEGEAKTKHVGLLDIRGQGMRFQPLRLQTVRPFIMRDITLKDIKQLNPKDDKAVAKCLAARVDELIKEVTAEWVAERQGRLLKDAPKPLVRLRVEYSGGFNTFNPQRFGQQFVEKVANPKEILQFYRKRQPTSLAAADIADGPLSSSNNKQEKMNILIPSLPEKIESASVEELVVRHLAAQKLDILPELEFSDAVRVYVDKDQGDAIKDFYAKSLETSQAYLKTQGRLNENDLARKATIEKEERVRQYNGGLENPKSN